MERTAEYLLPLVRSSQWIDFYLKLQGSSILHIDNLWFGVFDSFNLNDECVMLSCSFCTIRYIVQISSPAVPLILAVSLIAHLALWLEATQWRPLPPTVFGDLKDFILLALHRLRFIVHELNLGHGVCYMYGHHLHLLPKLAWCCGTSKLLLLPQLRICRCIYNCQHICNEKKLQLLYC